MKPIILLCLALAVTSGQLINWNLPVNGSFNDPLLWIGGILPSTSAAISAIGQFVVTATTPVTLTQALTLGGPGSLPTLFISGTTFTVPLLNFVSGTINVVNGSLISGSQIIVNSTGTVTINVVNGVISSSSNGINIAKGNLQLTGTTIINDTISIANGSALLLAGTHNSASCNFLGSGLITVTGRLNLPDNIPCNFQSNVLVLAGGFINSTAGTIVNIATVTVNGLNSTIQGIDLRMTTLRILAGTIDIVAQAEASVTDTLEAVINGTATIRGNLMVTGQTLITQGTLVVEGLIDLANATVANAAQFVVQQATLAAANIENNGKIFFNRVVLGLNETAEYIVVTGGEIYTNTTLIVQAGVAAIEDAQAQLVADIKAGATLVINNVTLTVAQINNTGHLILEGSVSFTQDFLYYSYGNLSRFTNNGSVSAEQDGSTIQFEGLGNIEGAFENAVVSIKGPFMTTKDLSINGTLLLAQGALATVEGNVMVAGDVIVTQGSALVASLNGSAHNITTFGNMIVNQTSQVIVEGAIKVGQRLQVDSILNVTKGALEAGSVFLSNASTYAVRVASNTSSNIMTVLGEANLGGVLEVNAENAVLNAGQTAIVINYGSRNGEFTNFQIKKRSPDSVNYGPKSASVTRGTDTSTTDSTTGTATGTVTGSLTNNEDSAAFRIELGLIILPILALLL